MHGEPAVRDAQTGYYNAAVLDFDGNSIEVVHRDADHSSNLVEATAGRPEGSRVLTWQRDVARSFADGRSVVSAGGGGGDARTVASRGPAPTVVVSSPPPQAAGPTNPQGDAGAKAIIGTLLGAAAGAAVAYAMTKSEDPSAPPQAPSGGTLPHLAAAAQSIYRAIEAAPSASASQTQTAQRQYQPTVQSKAPTTILLQDLEYDDPDPAIYPTRSSHASQVRTTTSSSSSSAQRPRTVLRAIEAPPHPSPSQTQAQSIAPRSTLIATFVPPTEIPRRRPGPPPAGVHSETHLSVRAASQSSRPSRPATVVRAASTQDVPSAPRSLVGSVLGLGTTNGGLRRDEELASVAPSDSVSQVGSKKDRSSHSHSKSKAGSRHSSTSRARPGGSRQGSEVGSRKGGGGSVVRGEVEEEGSEGSEGRRSRASSQRTVKPGKKGSVAASVPTVVGRTASRVGSGGGGGDKARSVVSLGLAGMGMGNGIGKGAGSSVESRAGGAKGWA